VRARLSAADFSRFPPRTQLAEFLVLVFAVTGCSRLRDTEIFSRQDPYVIVEYANTKLRTRTCTGIHPLFSFPPANHFFSSSA
jgi:hypothetical protein